MKVHIELNPFQEEVEIIVRAKEVTDEIHHLLKMIEGGNLLWLRFAGILM
ncbi:hypothetical protein [Bacillus gaemokensis]|nr:hypothetical protein [Bacillus gaemokensis]